MKKRMLCLLLSLSMVTVMLGACGKTEDKADENQTNEDDSNSSLDDTNDTADEDKVTGEDNDKDEDKDTSTASDPVLTSIYEEVKAAYGDNYLPSVTCDSDTTEAIYGINADWYEAAIVEVPLISTHVDTFMGFKAEEEDFDALLKAVTDYQDRLKADTMQYPSNQAKIQASRVVHYGDYVFFIMLGIIDNEEQETEGLIKDYTAQNKIATDIIESQLNQ